MSQNDRADLSDGLGPGKPALADIPPVASAAPIVSFPDTAGSPHAAEFERANDLANQLAVQRVRAETAEEFLDAVRSRAEDLANRLDDARAVAAAVEDQHSATREEIRALDSHLTERQARLNSAKARLTAERARGHLALRQASAASEQAAGFEELMLLQRERVETLERQLAVLNARVQASRKQAEIERARADEAETRHAVFRERMATAEREVAVQHARGAMLEASLAADRARAEGALQRAEFERGRAEALVLAMEAQRERSATLQGQLDLERARLAAAEPLREVERSRAEAASREMESWRERSQALESRLLEARDRLSQIEADSMASGIPGPDPTTPHDDGQVHSPLSESGHVEDAPRLDRILGIDPGEVPARGSMKRLISAWTARLRDRQAIRANGLGDAARERGDWGAAAEQYRRYLSARPGDFAIWVQLGHALKESGRLKDALDAYGEAFRLDQDDADLLLNIGHLLKLMGRLDEAVLFYQASAGRDGQGHALRELERVAKRRESPNIWFDATWYASQYGTPKSNIFQQFITLGANERHLPSSEAAYIMKRFGGQVAFSLAIYNRLVEASDLWSSGVPRFSIRLLTELYEPEWHGTEQAPLDGFLSYMRVGLPLGASPGPLFNADIYAVRAREAGLPTIDEGSSAVLHWMRHGIEARIVPSDRFDEGSYFRSYPDIDSTNWWGFEHFIRHGRWEGRSPNSTPSFYCATNSGKAETASMQTCYIEWHALDFADHDNVLIDPIPVRYRRRLGEFINSVELKNIFMEVRSCEPAVGDLNEINTYYLAPFHQRNGLRLAHAEVRTQLPRTHYDTIICVPWIRVGGADLVAGLLAKSLLRVRPDEQVLVLRTDNPHFERANWLPAGIDCVDISDLSTNLGHVTAEMLLRTIFRGVTAKRVFNVNSRLCWNTMAHHGSNLAANIHTYAYIFCWDQTPSGRRVGYPAEFFAETAASMTKFMTDTIYLRDELTRMYCLPVEVRDRVIPLFTPAQTAIQVPSIARQVLKAGSHKSRTLVLWAGRLDRQKRFDLVQDIARRMPDVDFWCWGEALLDTPPNTSTLPANVFMKGLFDSFDDLPLAEAGVWLFTSLWEGMPTTIIELATRGVPIVASAVGGVPELIRPDTGWPVASDADADGYVKVLREALSSPEIAVRRSEALQRRVAEIYNEAVYDAALDALLAGEAN